MSDLIELLSKIPSGFYGSLLGSTISGSVAIGILGYQVRQKNKENNYRCYGAMKISTIHCVTVKAYSDLTKDIFKVIRAHPHIADKTIIQLKRPRAGIEKVSLFLENERDNIPYGFISRYLSITNSLTHVIRSYDDILSSGYNEIKEKGLLDQLEHLEDIYGEFMKHGAKYIKSIEKKYKIKDFY